MWPGDGSYRWRTACFVEELPMGEEEEIWKGVREWWKMGRLGVPFIGRCCEVNVRGGAGSSVGKWSFNACGYNSGRQWDDHRQSPMGEASPD
jgi:hypothetical protein